MIIQLIKHKLKKKNNKILIMNYLKNYSVILKRIKFFILLIEEIIKMNINLERIKKKKKMRQKKNKIGNQKEIQEMKRKEEKEEMILERIVKLMKIAVIQKDIVGKKIIMVIKII